jgi:hypothetical protein
VQPVSPHVALREPEPNVELLRRNGWSVNSIAGPYCVAFRGRDEVVFRWQDGAWQRVGGRGGADGF